MTIKQLAQKLRHAADVLDDLMGLDRPTVNETPATAVKIRAALATRRYKPGTHWTQRPENRAKLLRMVKRSGAGRKAS